MALPRPTTSQLFARDQRIAFQAHYWDTTSTAIRLGQGVAAADRLEAFGTGLEFGLFDIVDPAFTLDRVTPTATLDNPALLTSVLGYEAGAHRTGVVPNLYMYWGAGAPTGATTAKASLLTFAGWIQSTTPSVSLVFAGQGALFVRVRHTNGTYTTLLDGTVREPSAAAQTTVVSPSVITDEWGYRYTTPRVFLTGERVEVFYWHNGEPWGGIAAKVVPGPLATTSDAFLRQVREAPVLGTSFMAKEQTPLAALTIPYLVGAEVRQDVGQIGTLQLRVALTRDGDSDGWAWDDTEGCLFNVAQPGTTLKVGRVVHFEAGYALGGTQELYPRFTGTVEDIAPSPDGEVAVLSCRSFDARLAEVFDENVPDRLDYHAAGFVLRQPSSEPVFGIPAADHWPIESFLLALMAKAGIDHWNVGLHPGSATSDHGKFQFTEATTGARAFGARLFAARGFSSAETLLQLDRNTNYGNVPPLVRDFLPPDDAYLFPPDVTQRLYDRARAVVENFGYDFFFNAEGQCVLTGRNNPTFFQFATVPGTYAATAPATHQRVAVGAVGGIYHGITHAAGTGWNRVIEGRFARLDLYVGVGENADGLNGGRLSVTVQRTDGSGGWVTVDTTTVSTFAARSEAFYYDDPARADGTNAAVIPLMARPFDLYRVTIAPAGPDTTAEPGATDCWYRVNGVAVYERDAERTPFWDGTNPQAVSTLGNAVRVSVEGAMKDLRNHVIVVGGRKATVTDSAKFAEGTVANNPAREFHVSVAADPYSIYDPTADNFIGGKRMTVVFDDRVTDSNHARWLTRTILQRFRMPEASARIGHTAIPALELRDALFVVEEAHLSANHTVWVTGFAERWTSDEAMVDLETVAYPEIPSYQPREDIDVDALFVDPADGKGEPVIDLTIGYRNIYGRQVGNGVLSQAAAIKGFRTRGPGSGRFVPMHEEPVAGAVSHTTAHPPIPETMYLGVDDGIDFAAKGYTRYRRRALVNGPYRRFYTLAHDPATHVGTLAFDFQEGDGSAGVYDAAYYQFPSGMPWTVCYDSLQVRSGENPWYDPYTSELGNLVNVGFTQLVSGRVRVSVWAYSDTLGLEVPVAWLTAPEADPETPEAHWVYSDAGRKTFAFDGVDNIGLWNSLQSQDYAEQLKGAFGDKPMAVGAGFYAWNDRATNLFTLIGDHNQWDNNDSRGLRRINYDASGAPYYTIGQYSQFYVKVEVANDALLRRDFANGVTQPRTVDSRALPTSAGMNTHAETYIWQHLGEPTQVAIRVQDWANVDGSGGLTATWTQSSTTGPSDWTAYSTPDADATLRIGKPVRFTFVPRPHRGPMWETAGGALSADAISVKLTRQVHLKATVFDQFWSLPGTPWSNFHTAWVDEAAGIEQKRLQNRMFHNEDHTLEYEDSNWRTGASFAAYEWIFDPTLFEKDFGRGLTEALRYGDYEQLEALPGFDAKQLGGTGAGARAYMMLAYLSYLFYFSAFVIDRSGRRQHCLNSWMDGASKRGWIDKTKIVTPQWRAATSTDGASYRPQYVVDYETRGADRYLPRSVFVRQWVEPGWLSGAYPGSPVTAYTITDAHHLAHVQFKMSAISPYTDAVTHPLFVVGANPDTWSQQYAQLGSFVARQLRFLNAESGGGPNGYSTRPVLGPEFKLASGPTSLGTWTWDRPGLTDFHLPVIPRDFHPYVRYPLTPDPGYGRNAYLRSGPYQEDASAHNVYEFPSANLVAQQRDPSAQEQWFGYAFSHAFVTQYAATWTPVFNAIYGMRWAGPRVEQTVEGFGETGRDSRSDSDSLSAERVAAMYDYARMDALDRWEQFRGVLARAPFPDRNGWSASSDWRKFRTSVQPVRPSGTYLFSVGRILGGISLSPITLELKNARHHRTGQVTGLFDLQFFHEYVWYNDRYFPVTRNGGAAYMFLRDEFTGVSGRIGYPWSGGPVGEQVDPVRALYFDAGAWVGWRPDIETPGALAWQESQPITELSLTVTNGEQSIAGSFPSRNIFDEFYSMATGPRLAVAFRLPEERVPVMNLSLPARLRGN